MGSKQSSTPAPDPRLVDAQIRSMGYQDTAIQQMLENSAALLPLQQQQMQFGIDTSRTAYEQAQADRAWMLDRRGGLSSAQDRLVADMQAFNEGGRARELVAQSQADVNAGFAMARAEQDRALARTGVAPGSGKSLAFGNAMSMQQALALGSAADKMRTAARQEGYALTDRATNALAGYPAMGMSAAGAGAGFGMGGLNAANAGLGGMNSGYGAAGGMAGAMGQNATSMWGAQANYKAQQDAAAAANDPLSTMLGAAAGVGTAWALKPYSDRRVKTDIRRVGYLDNGLPVYTYRYKSGGPVMMGVMADEVRAVHPDAVDDSAPDGFSRVDYSLVGV